VKIRIENGLPYVTATLTYRGQQMTLEKILLDTGSVGTIFSADEVLAVGLQLEPDDIVHRIRGVGGTEFVFTKRVDNLALAELAVNDFEIEVGAMAYGFDIAGIVGMDFLRQVEANIDLARLEIYRAGQ
jgi:hypothetical protein